jgi:Tfp pilus assembly protein PilO
MNTSTWRERWLWWLPALVLLLANLIAFGWFELAYSGAAQSLDQRLERRTAEVDRVEALVSRQRKVLDQVHVTEAEVAEFSSVRLSSPEARLTAILREVRALSARAGLEPSAFAYPDDQLKEYGLEKRFVNFSITADYMKLRRFLNLLELSDSFLTLEEVSLAGRPEEQQLRITLRVSTLFSTALTVMESPEGEAP